MRARNPIHAVPVLHTVSEKVVCLGRLWTTNVAEKSKMGCSRFHKAGKGVCREVNKQIASVLKFERHGVLQG
jgi:hypothetical protein